MHQIYTFGFCDRNREKRQMKQFSPLTYTELTSASWPENVCLQEPSRTSHNLHKEKINKRGYLWTFHSYFGCFVNWSRDENVIVNSKRDGHDVSFMSHEFSHFVTLFHVPKYSTRKDIQLNVDDWTAAYILESAEEVMSLLSSMNLVQERNPSNPSNSLLMTGEEDASRRLRSNMVHWLSIPPEATKCPDGERQQVMVQLDWSGITCILFPVHVSQTISLESRAPETAFLFFIKKDFVQICLKQEGNVGSFCFFYTNLLSDPKWTQLTLLKCPLSTLCILMVTSCIGSTSAQSSFKLLSLAFILPSCIKIYGVK